MRIDSLTVLRLLALSHATQVVHGWQCWHASILYTLNLQTSLDGTQEYATCLPSPMHQGTAHTPWTHPQTCTPVLSSINSPLCIYTSTTFANNRGISIFTTPALAKTFASLPAFTNPSLPHGLTINKPTNVYNATSIPGKGIGMLATKPLAPGDKVTSYTPAFLAYLESELSTMDREAMWRVAIDQLPSPLRASFLRLATVYADPRVRVQDVVKANTFQVDVGGVNHLAVWPETSRLNHACAPNAQYVINTELLTHTVRVTRPIARGEEITISYTSPLEPTSMRQQHLQQGFHFTCSCRRCASPSTTDATLTHIQELQSQLNDWAPASAGSPALAEQLLDLYRGEGLEGFMDMAYGFAALAYSAVGDAGNAIMYAEKAKEAILMKDGMWAPNLRLWDSLMGDLEGHWSWMRRRRV